MIQGPTIHDGISGVAASQDGHYVLLNNSGVWVVQVEADATPACKVLSHLDNGFGDSAAGLAVSPDGHYVFTAPLGIFSDYVAVYEVKSGPSFEWLSLADAGSESHLSSLMVSRDGRLLFATNNCVLVYLIDKIIPKRPGEDTLHPLQTLSVGSGPEAIAASPDGSFICVANAGDNTISVIEPVLVSM